MKKSESPYDDLVKTVNHLEKSVELLSANIGLLTENTDKMLAIIDKHTIEIQMLKNKLENIRENPGDIKTIY